MNKFMSPSLRLEFYLADVEDRLDRFGYYGALSDAERTKCAVAVGYGIGPGDCACQIVADRLESTGRDPAGALAVLS